MNDDPPALESEEPDSSLVAWVSRAFRYRWPKAGWVVPEIGGLTFVLMTVFAAAATLFDTVSFGGSVGGGVMLTIASWTYWATDPLLAVMLLLASSLAWHQATRGRDALDRANGAATAEPEDAPGSLEASDSWGRLQRAHVIAALAGFCALLTAVAVLLVVVASWSGSDFGIRRHLGAVVDGLGPAVGAVATVVIGWKTHLIWRGLVCYDEPGATELNGADDDPSFESLPGAPY